MKFNNGPAIQQDCVKRRKLLDNKGNTAQASICQGIIGVEPPPGTTRALQSFTFSPSKVKPGDQLPSINEKQVNCNGKYRQVGESLKNQEAPNDNFFQSSSKKRKLYTSCHFVPGERLSGRHLSDLEDEKQRKLTRGKVAEDQSAFPIFQEIKREHLPRHEVSKEYLQKATIQNRSESSEFGKVNNINEFKAQRTVGQALDTAAEHSCSSVSSSESFTARDCTSLENFILSRPLPDMNDENSESCPSYMNGKHKMVMSGENQASAVHRLESLAYRSVLNALRARGPLDWHQELLLTDLRLSLHITNDEHRLELTHMCSAQDVRM